MTLNPLIWTAGGAVGGTLLATPLVREWARRTGRVARPKADRWHTQATALMGGIAMFAGFAAGIMAALAAAGGYAQAGEVRAVAGIAIAALIMFATGVADDLWHLRPTSKLVLQGLAGAVLVTMGARFVLTPWEPVNAVVTLFWFIALTNALNLLDNMDGVTAGVSAVGGAVFALLFALQGDWLLALTGVALLGAGVGFLPFNFRPASIFMGDSGSLFLGAVLAGLGSAYSASPGAGPTMAGVLIPGLVAVVPLLDTILVMVTRTRARIPITQGGRDHVAHRLVSMGLSERAVALLLYALAAVGGACALLVHGGTEWSTPWLVALFALAVAVFGAYLTRLHAYAPADPRRIGRVAILLEALLFKRRALEVLFDLVVFAVAYSGAYLLRWDSHIPGSQVDLLSGSVAMAVACKSIAFATAGVYRGIWHRLSLDDVHRILKAAAVGTVLTVVGVVFGFREADYSRSVFLLDGLLVVVFAVGIRMSFRSLDYARVTLRMTGNGARTLIYGAGRAGDLAVRELHANPGLGLEPVAFVDDDGTKRGCLVQGLVVLGEFHDMERLIPRYRITRVVVSTGKLPEARWRALTRLCHEHRVDLLALEVKIATLREEPRVAVAQFTRT